MSSVAGAQRSSIDSPTQPMLAALELIAGGRAAARASPPINMSLGCKCQYNAHRDSDGNNRNLFLTLAIFLNIYRKNGHIQE
jgi:hypothetical protein